MKRPPALVCIDLRNPAIFVLYTINRVFVSLSNDDIETGKGIGHGGHIELKVSNVVRLGRLCGIWRVE